MALRSLIQLRGLLEGLPGGSMNIAPPDIQNNTPPQEILQLELLEDDNTIPVPTSADGCIIIFDPTAVNQKRIKGDIGDGTGIIVSKTKWVVLTFDATPIANFVITADIADAVGKPTTIIFF